MFWVFYFTSTHVDVITEFAKPVFIQVQSREALHLYV